MSGPSSVEKSLAEEIRKAQPAFLKAATEAFHRRFALEYHRLRGYALDQQSSVMELSLKVVCNFKDGEQSVTIEAVPKVSPLAGVTKVNVER